MRHALGRLAAFYGLQLRLLRTWRLGRHALIRRLIITTLVAYAALAIGLGTIGLDLLLIVTVTSYLRRHLDPLAWRWLHRMSYPMFGVFALHALLSGTDFGRPLVLAPAAGVIAFIAIVTLARLAFGRMETTQR